MSVPRSAARRGLTLIEILISTAVTLIMIFAIVQLFERVGEAVYQGRAAMEMSGQLRGASHAVRSDLEGLTCPVRPWREPGRNEGYFEYIEGPYREGMPNAAIRTIDTTMGDHDDILMFTARKHSGEPFIGRFRGQTIEAYDAEIVWFTHLSPADDKNGDGLWDSGENLTLRRRTLLIRPDLNDAAGFIDGARTTAELVAYYNDNDVSAHFVRDPLNPNTFIGLKANTLGDLTRRECRFAHDARQDAFPHGVVLSVLRSLVQTGPRQGDDLVLSGVLAFDVGAYDPYAPIYGDGNRAVVPGDFGYRPFATSGAAPIGYGAFVDLRYGDALFSPGMGQFAHNANGFLWGAMAVDDHVMYCTWSTHYEYDGINQVSTHTDGGTDGLDTGGQVFGPDDATERETRPPFAYPMRGLRVSTRIYDPDSRQVRQASVSVDFVPE